MSQNNFENFEYEIFPFIVIGAEMVGKSSLVNRFIDDTFSENISRTLAIDYKSKKISSNNNTTRIIRIWDTAGQEKYNSITQGYYRQGDCVLLCFSITNRKSFEQLEYYLSMIKIYAKLNVLIILVGTHQDKGNIRDVSLEDIREFKENNSYNFEYFEISSKTGVGINELFNRCIELLSKNKKNLVCEKIKINKNRYENRYENMCCVLS
jgi:small GTP-binding protein